jgi:prepilin peptidase CpaA
MDVAKGVVLVALLAVACRSDLRARRISNVLVLVTAAIGIAFAVAGVGWLGGLARAGGGLITGLAIWFPFFAFGMLGAGDVKLFAASATFLGARAAVEGALYTALCGGILAAVFMIANSGWSATAFRIGHATHQPMLLRQEPGTTHGRRLPYALAIAAGVLTALWWPGHILG